MMSDCSVLGFNHSIFDARSVMGSEVPKILREFNAAVETAAKDRFSWTSEGLSGGPLVQVDVCGQMRKFMIGLKATLEGGMVRT